MGCEEKRTDIDFSKLVLSKKSEGYLYHQKAVFYDNGNSVIIPSGPSVYLYSTGTGNFLKELLQGVDNIISCQLHPLQDSLLIVVTENGDLTVFNLKSNEIEYSVRLKLNQHLLNKQNAPKFDLKREENGSVFDWETQPLDSLSHRKFYYAEVKCFQNDPTEVYVWTSWCLTDEFQCHLSVFTFKSGKHIRLYHMQKSGLQKSYLNFVTNTVQKPEVLEVFVGLCDKYVHVIKYDSQRHPYSVKHYMGLRRSLTCLAFHPTECCFATGDSSGRITIWSNIFEKHPLKEVLHWHTLPVGDIYFSKFGNFLFSGGGENVLVKWSLSSNSKDFLPRLSSCIHRISGHSDSSVLSVSTADNKVMILDFNFQNISTVQNFSKWSILKENVSLQIFTIDPRTNSLVLNGKTGHIQFLSLNEGGKFIYTFDVTNRNLITSDGDNTIENTEVTHAKFSKNGRWLFTFESRWDGFCKECRLKFWMFSLKHSSFVLNTNVEFPHGDFPIHSLEVSVDGMMATTGGDKNFRLWTLFQYKEKTKRKVCWTVQAVNKYRNFPCHGLDFSKDNSLIAVTFGPVLTIWDTESCLLKCSLSVPYNKHDFKFCHFGNFELSHLLVTSTDLMICTWNIITLSVIWMVPLKVNLLISDPFSLHMAVFSADNHLVIFSPSSPTPDFVIKKVSDSPVVAALSTPIASPNFTLYFLNANQELFTLEDSKNTQTNYPSNAPLHTISTPFTAQLAEIRNQNHSTKGKTVPLNRNNTHSVSALMDAPAHTLPNPSALCMDVLKGLLLLSDTHSTNPHPPKQPINYFPSNPNRVPPDAPPHVDSNQTETKLLTIVQNIFL